MGGICREGGGGGDNGCHYVFKKQFPQEKWAVIQLTKNAKLTKIVLSSVLYSDEYQ